MTRILRGTTTYCYVLLIAGMFEDSFLCVFLPG
jgi:hypothetical protein